MGGRIPSTPPMRRKAIGVSHAFASDVSAQPLSATSLIQYALANVRKGGRLTISERPVTDQHLLHPIRGIRLMSPLHFKVYATVT
jgi:hypothetical protein